MNKEEHLTKILNTKHKIFTPEFSYFIDVIGTHSEQKGKFDEYLELCKKISDTINGEHTTEVVLALTFHLTNVMAQGKNMDSVGKSKEILNRTDLSYI